MTPDLQSQPGNDLTATLREARSEYERQTRAQAPPTLLKNLDAEFLAAEEELLTQVPEHIEEHGYIEDKELLENIVLWKFPLSSGTSARTRLLKLRQSPSTRFKQRVRAKQFRSSMSYKVLQIRSQVRF